MKIKHIKIHNFRSIKDLSWIINEERIEVLIGKNSVGKSAIIDALMYLNGDKVNLLKEDQPNNIGQETNISITLELAQREIGKLDIDINDYFSKIKMPFLDRDNYSYVKISKIFPTESLYYFKINDVNLEEFIYQDIQRISKLLEDFKSIFNYKQYTIFNVKIPRYNDKDLNNALSALKLYYGKIRDLKPRNNEFLTAFGKVLEIIEKINNYKNRIVSILPKFIKFHFNENSIIPDQIKYNKDMLRSDAVKKIFFNMNRDFGLFIKNIGQHHIIDEISKDRNTKFEKFLSDYWLKNGAKIQMKFHPDYMVCSINDGFVSTTISQRSLGEKWLLTFLIFLYYSKKRNENVIILMDEPSINLHPNIQKSIIQMLTSIIERNLKIYLFFTTHSPYLIPCNNMTQISRVIKTKSMGTKIIKFSYQKLVEKINNRLTRTTATIDTTKARLSQMLTIPLREGFFGDGVILCEGETEMLALPVWAEILNFNFDNSGIILIQVSKFSMINYAEFFDVYEIPVFLIFDNDKDKIEDKKNHIENNKWLIGFARGINNSEEYPEGAGKNYYVFSPKYEKCLKHDDLEYSVIEPQISIKYGTSRKKGIKARYIALKYKEISRKPPKSIINLFEAIKRFQKRL